MKLSILIATNRLNNEVYKYIEQIKHRLQNIEDKTIFVEEFMPLLRKRVNDSNHFLDLTLNSLQEQTDKDFEIIISHKHPEDAIDVVKNYPDLHLKLVKEKPSIWHNLGEQYHTVANNKNSALIHARADYVFHTDDMIFFNDDITHEISFIHNKNRVITYRTNRRIIYNEEHKDIDYIKRILTGQKKMDWIYKGLTGQYKPLTPHMESHWPIPLETFWTCGASADRNELIEVNGFEELLDGSLCGIDVDAGVRLAAITEHERVASDNFIYEIDDPREKNMVRNDVILRRICRQDFNHPRHIKANSWKPNKYHLSKYRYYHEKHKGQLDKNWDKLLDVPMFNIKDLIKNPNEYSEVVYES